MSKYVTDWSKYPNFDEWEFRCPCCGSVGNGIATTLVDALQDLRNKTGKAITISSGYRCSKRNKAVGGVSNSKHLYGMAADFYFNDGSLADQNKRIALVNELKQLTYYNYAYCNVNGNYKNMGSAIHLDTKLVDPEAKEETATLKHKVGEIVKINAVYISSTSTNKINPAKTIGKITKIVEGSRNPYLLENGNIGWVNDDCIVETTSYIQINVKDGVWCRTDGYGFNYPKYKVIPYQTKCKMIAKNVGTANGYNWDKVVYENKTVYLPNKWNKYI